MSEGADEYFPLVYDELRRLAAARIAAERPGHTLDATALVHEAFVRMGGVRFAGRGDFLRAAGRAMQCILVDHARARGAGKRGGGARRWALDERDRLVVPEPDALLDLADALDRLAAEDPGAADLARLRLFGGLSIAEAGEALGLSRASAFREWAYARAWLAATLADPAEPGGDPA